MCINIPCHNPFSVSSHLCFSTVIIGFKRLHYKVKEGEGCVEVCLELLAGQLKPPDSVSFILNTTAQTAMGKKNFQKHVD